jgi:hypothetical protein
VSASGVTFKLNVDASGVKSGAATARDALKDTASAADGTTQSLKDLERQADKTADAGAKIGNGIGAGIAIIYKAVAGAAAAYLGLSGLAIKRLDDIYVASQKLGTSTEFFSTLKTEAEQSGVAFAALGGSLNTFSSNLARAAGGSKVQSQLFAEMGISVRDSAGHFKSLEQILPEVADRFASYKDGPDKAALANRLFGESGSDLIPLLNDLGDKGFAKVREEAEKLGLVVNNQTAKAAHDFNDQMTALKLTTEAYFNKVAADVLPTITELAQRFNGAATDAADLGDRSTYVGTALKALVSDAGDLLTVLSHLPEDARNTAAAFGDWADQVERLVRLLPQVKSTSGNTGLFDFGGTNGYLPGVEAVRNFFSRLNTPTAGSALDTKMTQDLADPFKDLDKALKLVVPDIDTASASFDGLAHHVDAATSSARKFNSPFADLSRGNGSHDNTAALEENLQSFERYADSLSEKVGGPVQQAWQKYADTIAAIDAKAERLVISGADVNRVIAAQNVAYANATATLRQHLSAITLEKEQTDAHVVSLKNLQDALGEMAKEDEAAIDLLQAQIDAGGELNIVQQRQLAIKELLKGATDAERKSIENSTKAALDNAAARQRVTDAAKLQQVIFKGIDDLIEETRQGVINGEDGFKSLGDAAARILPGIAKQFDDIVASIAKGNKGTVDFSKALSDMGGELQKALPALGQLVGTIAGGGGTGAQTGSAVGSIVGGIIGGVLTSWSGGWGYAIGAAIGGLVGGVAGGQGDGNGTPAIYGSSRPGSVGRDRTAPINTPFGIFAADTDNLSDDAYKAFEATVKGFDIQLAKLFDPAQLDKVQDALKNFSGKFSDINALLQARFDVILGTFDSSIQDFVNGFAADLQGRVQALSDVLSLQKLDKAGVLITDSLSDALTVINEFSQAGERVLDTYQRLVTSTVDYQQALQLMGVAFDGTKTQLVEFAQGISDAVGTTQEADALWQQFFKDFYSQAEITAGNINLLQVKANDSLTKIGLDSTISMEDFRKKFESALPTLSPEEVAQWLQAGVALGALNDAITALIQQGEDLVDKLYGGGSLSDVNAQIAALQGQSSQASTSVQHFGRAMTSAASAAKAAADLLLGALSPLNDQQKLQYALAGLRNGTVSQEQVLQIGRNLYASSQAYTDLFNMVMRIGDHTGASSNFDYSGAGSSAATHSALSPDDQKRLDDLIARRDMLEARERRSEANQLATTVAQLSLTEKESFQQVADELGFNLDDLAKDLGLTSDQLNTFLKNIQTQQTAIPDSVNSAADRQIKAMYDIAGKQVPPWALTQTDDTSGATVGHGAGHSQHGTPGNDDGRSVVVGRVGHSVHGTDSGEGRTGNTATTMKDAMATTNTLLRQIVDGVREGTAATREVVTATRSVNTTLRTPVNTGRRSARVSA